MHKLSEQFQFSTETSYKTYHKVMRYVLVPEIYESTILKLCINTSIPSPIFDNAPFYPWFKDCFGVVDATLIPISLFASQGAFLWVLKSGLSQNILAICDFDMTFIHVMSVWTGSIADSTLWAQASWLGAVSIFP